MSGIILIDNQPIQLYKQSPTDAELALGMTAWEQTAYHKRLGNCDFIGPDYCHPVLNTDFMTFQFKLPTTGDNVLPQLSSSTISSGLNTSVGSSQLIDSIQDFIADGVVATNVVVNATDSTSSFVNNVASGTTLDLDDDIFPAFPVSYRVLSWKGAGEWRFDIVNDLIHMDTPSPTTLYKEGDLVVGTNYKVTINVFSVTAGNFQVKLGTNSIATINSVGTHVLYGECETDPDFILQASSSFVGSIVDDIEVLAVNTEYTIAIFDLDGNYVTAIAQDAAGSDSLSIGNVLVNIEWGNFALECGPYIVALYEGDVAPCSGNMVTNGNFSSATGWTTGTNISIGGGKAEFISAPEDATLQNALSCCLKSGNSYTLTFDVGNVDILKEGSYRITQIPGTPSFNAALQTSVSITFTAEDDSCTLAFVCVNECTFSLDNVVLTCNDCVLDQDDADSLSECYCVCDAHECTVLLKYKNENNAFGLYYDENSPYNYFRIEASVLSTPIKDKELIQFKNTLHFMNIPYWDGMKVFTLATDLVPAWVHNTLAVALKHRELLIDSVRYVSIEEHTYSEELTEIFGGETKIALWNQQNLNNTY